MDNYETKFKNQIQEIKDFHKCVICYSNFKNDALICKVCQNLICQECHEKLLENPQKQHCPYCRGKTLPFELKITFHLKFQEQLDKLQEHHEFGMAEMRKKIKTAESNHAELETRFKVQSKEAFMDNIRIKVWKDWHVKLKSENSDLLSDVEEFARLNQELSSRNVSLNAKNTELSTKIKNLEDHTENLSRKHDADRLELEVLKRSVSRTKQEEINNNMTKQEQHTDFCTIHKANLEAFCEECNQCVCMKCVLGEHQKHKLVEIDKVYVKWVAKIRETKWDIKAGMMLCDNLVLSSRALRIAVIKVNSQGEMLLEKVESFGGMSKTEMIDSVNAWYSDVVVFMRLKADLRKYI